MSRTYRKDPFTGKKLGESRQLQRKWKTGDHKLEFYRRAWQGEDVDIKDYLDEPEIRTTGSTISEEQNDLPEVLYKAYGE